MASGVGVTRRRALGLVGRLGLGVGGAALGGVLQNPQMRTAAASDQAAALDEPAIATERRPYSAVIEVRYATDLVNRYGTPRLGGPRNAAMRWGLDEFAEMFPHINVLLKPVRTFARGLSQHLGPEPPPPPLSVYTGDARRIQRTVQRRDPEPLPHVVLLSQEEFLRLGALGGFLEINGVLAKFGSYQPEKHFFVPDSFTESGFDHSSPQPTEVTGRQFGLPFELSISGFLANVTVAESAGVRLPDSENSWTWDDWTEWDARMTDPETGTFGTWARDDYAGQYMPQMYTNGLKKPFDDGLTKTMFDQPEAWEAWTYLIDKVFERKTSPGVGEAKELAGEYGNPFAAGKVGIWPTEKVGATGVEAPRIKDRFTWTLLPEVVAPGGGPPGHSWSMRANLVTLSAVLEGSVEEAVLLAEFLAGETFQGRVGMERGHVPVHRSAIEEPDAIAPPPGGMKWLKVYADRPDNRSPYPFQGWETWWRHHKGLAWKGWFGTQSAEAALAACQAWGERYFSFYDGPKPFVREPVYP